jgi:putative membrane protein
MMGATDVIPGVSGATIAVLLGIYNRLLAALNGIFSKDWKKHLSFLIPLGVGIVIAIFTIARVMEWLLIHHPGPTFYFFLGLIIGVLPFLFNVADAKSAFKKHHIIILFLSAILIGSMEFLHNGEETIIEARTMLVYVRLFFSGVLGSAVMVLPGISGAFVLLLIGVYPTLMSAVSNFEFDVIIVTGAGILIGIITMSKVVNYLFKHYRTATFAAIIGMVIGSIFVVFPGWPISTPLVFVSILTFAAGLAGAYVLGKVEYKE